MHPLRFGLKLSGQDTTIETLRAVWRIADEAGFDHVWDFDHLAAIGDGGPDRPVFGGWALLAAMAVTTKRVRIGCLVTGNTYRHPVLVAKEAVTVDHLSGGRLEFGIGAAWAEDEHRMYGIEGLDHRVGRLSESLQIIAALWTQDRTSFKGRYYQLDEAVANPKPVQLPHPPIWIGASGEHTLRLVARHADVWNAAGVGDYDDKKEQTAKFEDACEAVGRDVSQIRRSVHITWNGVDRASLIDEAARFLELGFTEQIIHLRGDDPGALAAKIAELLPDLRSLDRVRS
jgi:F420-dependent oxidoreductase-like protein